MLQLAWTRFAGKMAVFTSFKWLTKLPTDSPCPYVDLDASEATGGRFNSMLCSGPGCRQSLGLLWTRCVRVVSRHSSPLGSRRWWSYRWTFCIVSSSWLSTKLLWTRRVRVVTHEFRHWWTYRGKKYCAV